MCVGKCACVYVYVYVRVCVLCVVGVFICASMCDRSIGGGEGGGTGEETHCQVDGDKIVGGVGMRMYVCVCVFMRGANGGVSWGCVGCVFLPLVTWGKNVGLFWRKMGLFFNEDGKM